MIEIEAHFGDWYPCSADHARHFVQQMMTGAAAIPTSKKAAWVEQKHLHGTTVDELLAEGER